MPEERNVKKTYKWKLIAIRPVGCPKIMWMDNVNERHPGNEDY
jgi:hypothetical protein